MHLRSLAFPALALALAGGIGAADERVVAYRIVDARAVPDSLTGRPGDPQRGRALYNDDKIARCAGCHGDPEQAGAVAPEAGPDPEAPSLGDAAERLGEGAVRLWLVAPQVIAPGTRMPAFYGVGQRMDPADPRFGEPLLTAAELEDLVAYLMQPRQSR